MSTIENIYQAFLKSTGVSTDSRNCPKGAMFIALKGERFDGNKYINAVLASGAAYAISDDRLYEELDNVFVVENTLKALQDLARYHRRQLNVPIIAITGTNGKTTTKELLAAVLSMKYNIKATAGNFNNHIGVPLTLLSFGKDVEIGIVEMGANHVGEIRELCEIAEPNYGMITNVGKAHLEGFGSFEGVKIAKGEMYDYIHKIGGVIFINKDNEHLLKMAKLNTDRYEYGGDGEVYGKVVDVAPFISIEWSSKKNKSKYKVQTNLIGGYNLENIISAVAIGVQFELDPLEINKAIELYQPTNNRSQFVETKFNKVIMDAYNANPSSMDVALRNFSKVQAQSKTIILGGMKEMGADAEGEHAKLVELIKVLNFNKVYLVGEEFKALCDGDASINWFADNESLTAFFNENPLKENYILVKGSRSNQLEKILSFL